MTTTTKPADGPPTSRPAEVEPLDEEACWLYLAARPVGRLAYLSQGRPRIVPLNHVVEGDSLYFVTTQGAKLSAILADPGAAVAYEVDGFDPDTRSGWSVVVEGTIHPVLDDVEQARLDAAGRPTWRGLSDEDRRWTRIDVSEVTGRRLPRGVHDGMAPTITVGLLAHTPIRAIHPLATLREAARQLVEEQIGALVVRDHHGIVGILSEADLTRAVYDADDLDEVRVRDQMSDRVVTIAPDRTLEDAADLMAANSIRHLVVEADDDQEAGVLSARDVLAALGR